LSRGGIGVDDAAVVLHDFFADSKPDAGAFVLAAAVQPLENGKYFSGIFFFKPNAVVP
jgi:hypothetical protein